MGPVYDLFDGSQIREGATLGASPAYCKILYQCAFNISTLFDRWQQWCGLLLSVLHQLVEWWCLQPRKHSKHLFRCSSLSACRNLWLDAEDQKYFFRWACLMQAPGCNTPLIRFFISYDLFCVEWDVKPQLNQSSATHLLYLAYVACRSKIIGHLKQFKWWTHHFSKTDPCIQHECCFVKA